MPTYRITHETVYTHAATAGAAWQMLQLRPRAESAQECLDFQLQIEPGAPDLAEREDFFGNRRHFFSVREPHLELAITCRSVVRREAPPLPLAGLTPPLALARQRTDELVGGAGYALEQYRHATAHVPFLPAAAALAADLGPPELPLLEWIERLGRRFAETFTFDAAATDVSTPLTEVLAQRRGVCQDFTHLFLSCVRQHGLPAAYVSGYLLTNPPPGQPRLRGADAMHAWAAVHVPDFGWVDYDPTNSCLVGAGHIVVARGRDYADVSPTRGVFTGAAPPPPRVGVTVEPEPMPA
ncbi:MAG: transglutaminase family protein [Candidatus Didemnitutus sp.]|nr:transglutaminase family protein [Candidatus Didemnitutus sp.]